MDLAIGARDVFVMMTLFAKDGTPKLVPQCTYPFTGRGRVSRVYTELGTLTVGAHGAQVITTYAPPPPNCGNDSRLRSAEMRTEPPPTRSAC